MVHTSLDMSSAYHLQMNGQTKVTNGDFGYLLRILVGEHMKLG